MAKTDIPLRCECGAVRGVAHGVDGDVGNRVVCYCGDCQSFQHFLGRADQVLDPDGGTDVFQMSPARLEINEGIENIACVRLKAGGLYRWYAGCCKTAIGNTLTQGVPFVGLIESFFDHASDGRSREETLGPVRARCNAAAAKAKARAKGGRLDAYDRAPISMLLRFGRILLVSSLKREGRRSPFFDPGTGEWRVKPVVLTEEQLCEIESARDAR